MTLKGSRAVFLVPIPIQFTSHNRTSSYAPKGPITLSSYIIAVDIGKLKNLFTLLSRGPVGPHPLILFSCHICRCIHYTRNSHFCPPLPLFVSQTPRISISPLSPLVSFARLRCPEYCFCHLHLLTAGPRPGRPHGSLVESTFTEVLAIIGKRSPSTL